jgi:glycosyltransferase involved in cell wall biosynthesis
MGVQLQTLTVIVPVFNEVATVATAVRRVQCAVVPGISAVQVLVVDDGSTDGTIASLPSDITVLQHERNCGKGAAIATALAHATGDLIVIQDADLEYDSADWPALLGPLLDGSADVVYGSRFIGSAAHRVLYFWHFQVNRLLTLLCGMVTNLNLTDMETGAKAFRRSFVSGVRFRERSFGIEPELTIALAHRGARFFEVGISYHGRSYAEGKKIRARDGIRALWVIVRDGILRPAGRAVIKSAR